MVQQNLSLEEISRIGEKFYLDELREKLELESFGQYVVIDVLKKEYVVNPDRFTASEEAKAKFGPQIFYAVQIGNLQEPTNNFTEKKYAWNF